MSEIAKQLLEIQARNDQAQYQPRRWLTVAEAARYLGVNERSCYDLIRDRKIPVLRIGSKRPRYRIAIDALDRMAQAMGDEAARRAMAIE